MTRISVLLTVLAVLPVYALHADAARAQTRVFVSTAGSDSNSCSVSAPCRTFAAAYTAAAANGEIDVLAPGGYGGLTIAKAISIQGHGFSGISVASSATGITINALSTDAVSLNGLLIDGGGVAQNGITFNTGKSLTVENCVVRNVTNIGLAFTPNSSTPTTLAVSNSYFTDSNNGITIAPFNSGALTASIDRTVLANNGGVAFAVQGNSGTGDVKVAVTDSAATNGFFGFEVTSAINKSTTNLSLTHSLASGNYTGVLAQGATLWLAQSTVIGNTVGYNGASGTINSYGDNYIANNGSNSGLLSAAGDQ